MKEEDFALLADSLKEAGAIRRGKRPASRVTEIAAPDVKQARRRLKLSQSEFAMILGVSVRTLQNWEQGRRQPVGPARALLRVATRNPQAVLDALHSK